VRGLLPAPFAFSCGVLREGGVSHRSHLLIRYHVLRDAEGAEVARFNEKDVVGIRKGRHVDVTARHEWCG